MASELELAWAAGFIDGEGCISISQNYKAESFRIRLTAAQKLIDPLLKLKDLFGGSLNKNEKSWHWEVAHASAGRALEQIEPYMFGNKRIQAQLAIEFQSKARNYEQDLQYQIALRELRNGETDNTC